MSAHCCRGSGSVLSGVDPLSLRLLRPTFRNLLVCLLTALAHSLLMRFKVEARLKLTPKIVPLCPSLIVHFALRDQSLPHLPRSFAHNSPIARNRIKSHQIEFVTVNRMNGRNRLQRHQADTMTG